MGNDRGHWLVAIKVGATAVGSRDDPAGFRGNEGTPRCNPPGYTTRGDADRVRSMVACPVRAWRTLTVRAWLSSVDGGTKGGAKN